MGVKLSKVPLGVKAQANTTGMKLYKLVDLKGGGELVECMKNMKDHNELDKKIIKDVTPFLYNGGSGKKIHISEFIKKRNEERGGKKPISSKENQGKRFLQKNKTDEEVADDPSENVLHMAIVNEDPAMVKFLLDHGVDYHQRCYGNFFCPDDQKDSRTDNWDHEEVDVCLETNFEGYTYWGEYPLAFAACVEQEECVRILCAKGANPNLQDSNGNTIMHILVIKTKLKMFLLLYSFGARLSIKNRQGLTPLALAAKLARKEDKEEHLYMMDGIIFSLLQEKWYTFARYRFYRRFFFFTVYFIIFVISFALRPGADPRLKDVTNTPISFVKNPNNCSSKGLTERVVKDPIESCYLLFPYTDYDYIRLPTEVLTVIGAGIYLTCAGKEIYYQGIRIFSMTLWANIVLVVEQTVTPQERVEQQKQYSQCLADGRRVLALRCNVDEITNIESNSDDEE
ncbi:transient receptor potential cation channel subfamily V member 5-like [Octopus vulgaris]|uniref:Transient receptor potential cation channel subfamily V member 5-like n=1 Tax=Octopus vulgaris TaxID=6645 RepID=A0AA36BRI6_OCTVU|nr:transient receptor potential cation channel subfamily V member 5-like [Octopus vulgaris]